MLASKSSSPIDPLPLSLFHKLSFILTPFIFNIISISLYSGIVPSSLKHAIIKPIKKIDLSAEFDTIDHSILIKRLEDIGIVGIPLAWVKSYLSERTFSIKIDNHYSSTCKMNYGVPQCSVIHYYFLFSKLFFYKIA